MVKSSALPSAKHAQNACHMRKTQANQATEPSGASHKWHLTQTVDLIFNVFILCIHTFSEVTWTCLVSVTTCSNPNSTKIRFSLLISFGDSSMDSDFLSICLLGSEARLTGSDGWLYVRLLQIACFALTFWFLVELLLIKHIYLFCTYSVLFV